MELLKLITLERGCLFIQYKYNFLSFLYKRICNIVRFLQTVINWLDENLKVRRKSLIETTKHLLNNRLKEFEKGFDNSPISMRLKLVT